MAREDIFFDAQRAGFDEQRAAEDIDADEAVPPLSTDEPDYDFPVGFNFQRSLSVAESNPTEENCRRALDEFRAMAGDNVSGLAELFAIVDGISDQVVRDRLHIGVAECVIETLTPPVLDTTGFIRPKV